MNSDQFPINYINSIFPPTKALKNRHQLSWLQMILLFLFMTFLMLLPVFNHYQNVDVFSIEDFYPNVVDMIDDVVLDELQQVEFSEGTLTIANPFAIETDQGIVAGGLETSYEEEANRLIFNTNHFIIDDETGDERVVNYTAQTNFSFDNKDELVHILSEMYTAQYRGELTFTLTMIIYGFILVFSLFIIFLYAFLIKSMKDFSMSSIITYKEAVNLVMNLIALPTIAAVLFGFIRFNIILMLAIQLVSLIGLLVMLFRQTNFED